MTAPVTRKPQRCVKCIHDPNHAVFTLIISGFTWVNSPAAESGWLPELRFQALGNWRWSSAPVGPTLP